MLLCPLSMSGWPCNLTYGTLVGLAFYFLSKYIRYDLGRELVLNFFVGLQGRRAQWVREPPLARRILTASSSKGRGLEQLLSTQAFCPVLSLESVNDDQWTRMKDHFRTLKAHLPPLQSLEALAQNITMTYLEENELVDSPTLAKLVVTILHTWLFRLDKPQEVNPILMRAIEEYRKEIAIKGQGDPDLKLYATHWIQDQIQKYPHIYVIFGERWASEEYWSLLLQPFFISPVINITDIAVTIASKQFKEEFKLDKKVLEMSEMENVIVGAINSNHPFPVLERWLPDGLKDGEEYLIQPNTHVFMPMDQIGRTTGNSKWSAFGAGKRACGGPDVALTLCTNMFFVILSNPKAKDKFKPLVGHNYSGRDNDLKEGWAQTFFQIKRLAQIVWSLVVR